MLCTFCPLIKCLSVLLYFLAICLGLRVKKDRLFRVEGLSKVTAPKHNPTHLGYMLHAGRDT